MAEVTLSFTTFLNTNHHVFGEGESDPQNNEYRIVLLKDSYVYDVNHQFLADVNLGANEADEDLVSVDGYVTNGKALVKSYLRQGKNLSYGFDDMGWDSPPFFRYALVFDNDSVNKVLIGIIDYGSEHKPTVLNFNWDNLGVLVIVEV